MVLQSTSSLVGGIACTKVAARSKAWFFGRSLAEIMGSNPVGGMDVCRECCVLSGRGLCDGLYSSRGFLPSVEYLSVVMNPR